MRPTTELLLLIEFLDEFVYGAREASWPLIRADLGLTYVQIGMLLGLPGIISGLTEPVLGILGDIWKRRVLVLGGGAVFALSLFLTGFSRTYVWLLLSFVLLSPASGAFVGLSQATLMDLAPQSHERTMARWTLAGSLGVVLGPLVLDGCLALAFGWRVIFIGTAVGTTVVLLLVRRVPFGGPQSAAGSSDETAAYETTAFLDGLRDALRALRRWDVMRWLLLLQFSDLMLDVLLGYLALYFVDVAQVTLTQASTAVAVWTGVGLLGDFLIVRLLTRVSGLRYLRISAGAELLLFCCFLVISPFAGKLLLLALLGLFNAGWYSILKAQLYSSLPGQSGVTMAVSNVFGLFGSLIPLCLGLVAETAGLPVTMWLLGVGPLALLVGLPREPTPADTVGP
ncbi:MAG: MFS transporter [Anaerolineae bacterium]|nr:MFS transporter [Anaerolineae bacterium]